MSTIKKLLLLFILMSTGALGPAQAQQVQMGDYTVHYIAVNSTFISPEIAAQYGIVRAPRNAFLNIAVIRNTGGTGTPVTAIVSGEKANLLGESSIIEFVEIREGDAIYYIGQFEFSNAETLRFNLQILPENSAVSYPLSWTTQMYVN